MTTTDNNDDNIRNYDDDSPSQKQVQKEISSALSLNSQHKTCWDGPGLAQPNDGLLSFLEPQDDDNNGNDDDNNGNDDDNIGNDDDDNYGNDNDDNNYGNDDDDYYGNDDDDDCYGNDDDNDNYEDDDGDYK